MRTTKRAATIGLALGLCVPAWFSVHAAGITQKSFSSPQEAVQAVEDAAAHNDTNALLQIFGDDGKDIVESGDRREDKRGRLHFVELAKEKTNIVPDPMNTKRVVVALGNDDWPFPIPLIQDNKEWRFDSSEGRKEILARRIGSNELTAMDVCRGYVEAQFEYAQTHQTDGVAQYASKIEDSSKHADALYWDTKKGAAPPPVPKAFARAAVGLKNAQPYHGYFYRVLLAQGPDAKGGAVQYIQNGLMIGGFALIAWPAEYGVSGIHTFIVNHDGVVYQKVLGPDTTTEVAKITEFNPDSSWQKSDSDQE